MPHIHDISSLPHHAGRIYLDSIVLKVAVVSIGTYTVAPIVSMVAPFKNYGIAT